jgi:anthranilate synthase/aminodeoxychorismate synthase-like glutamine amidotransferase
MIKVLLIDNNDSFTYNLAELLRHNGKVTFYICKAGTILYERISEYDKILFSPGPGIPEEHPTLFEILRIYGKTKSIFGVCLGHQAIAQYFGARLYNLDYVRHGEVVDLNILSPCHKLFTGIPLHCEAGLYHSWAVEKEDLPVELRIIAISSDGIIMGLTHQTLDICGVQFHPESVMTKFGQKLMDNWISPKTVPLQKVSY